MLIQGPSDADLLPKMVPTYIQFARFCHHRFLFLDLLYYIEASQNVTGLFEKYLAPGAHLKLTLPSDLQAEINRSAASDPSYNHYLKQYNVAIVRHARNQFNENQQNLGERASSEQDTAPKNTRIDLEALAALVSTSEKYFGDAFSSQTLSAYLIAASQSLFELEMEGTIDYVVGHHRSDRARTTKSLNKVRQILGTAVDDEMISYKGSTKSARPIRITRELMDGQLHLLTDSSDKPKHSKVEPDLSNDKISHEKSQKFNDMDRSDDDSDLDSPMNRQARYQRARKLYKILGEQVEAPRMRESDTTALADFLRQDDNMPSITVDDGLNHHSQSNPQRFRSRVSRMLFRSVSTNSQHIAVHPEIWTPPASPKQVPGRNAATILCETGDDGRGYGAVENELEDEDTLENKISMQAQAPDRKS